MSYNFQDFVHELNGYASSHPSAAVSCRMPETQFRELRTWLEENTIHLTPCAWYGEMTVAGVKVTKDDTVPCPTFSHV